MSKIKVFGGKSLKGEITVAGNKNSALKLMAASLLSESPSVLTNVPRIKDVEVMGKIIEKLGVKIEGLGTSEVRIDPKNISSYEIDKELSQRIRASVVLAAPLLVRFGKAVVTPPGGDQIGERLLDTHFSMMRKLGIDVISRNGKYELEWREKKASKVFLEEASVTATEMGLMLASALDVDTQIDDAATEPHVQDLADFLTKMGAKIAGSGTNSIVIKGTKNLNGVEHKVISDHIEAGTFIIASAITGGDVVIKDIVEDHYPMISSYLADMGVDAKIRNNEVRVLPSNLFAYRRIFKTRPWPGFPTDLMSPFIVLATQTNGTVLCHDWMYEWRVFFVDDLISMGANIFIADPHRVVVTGPSRLRGDNLICKDIRAGISILLAALAADGESVIDNKEVIERGYENIEQRLVSLGANLKSVE